MVSSIIMECSDSGLVGVSGLLSGVVATGAGVRVRRTINTEGLLVGVGVGSAGGSGLREGVLHAAGGGSTRGGVVALAADCA